MVIEPGAAGDRVAALYKTGSNQRVLLVDWTSGGAILDVLLGGAGEAAVRLTKETLAVTDSSGRILVFETSRGRLLRDLGSSLDWVARPCNPF